MKYKIRTEALDLIQYFDSSAHKPVLRALIQFSGRLDPELLRRAVNLSAASVPQIRCAFSTQAHGWEEKGFSAEQIVKVTESVQEDEAQRLFMDTIRPESEPPLKIHLLRGPEKDMLCVIFSHLVADGSGFKQYLYLLASVYRRCAEVPGFVFPPEPMDRDVGQVFRGMAPAERIQILRSHGEPTHPEQEKEALLPLEEKQGEPVLLTRRIGTELFAALKQYAKKADVTMSDLFLTAYGRVHASLTGCPDFRLPCPVNLRKFLPAGTRCGICNLTGSWLCHVLSKQNEPFRETLRRVAAQTRARNENRNCLKAPMILNFLFSALPYSAAKKIFDKKFTIPPVSFLNLGVLDRKRLDFGTGKVEQAYLAAGVRRPPSFQVSVSAFSGCCTLCSSLYATEKNRRVAEQVMDGMMTELKRAVSEHAHKSREKSKNNSGGDSHAKGQPAGQQEKPDSESKRADTHYKGKSKSKSKRKKTVR
ncbi:MAG: hypothetical protein LKJ17_05840 [Oscillospiraceae bacterium]|jgi:NRPS condensation-like uncharacterized protein|nr:hypothetical protein [Oscillospiraceae bacterium]